MPVLVAGWKSCWNGFGVAVANGDGFTILGPQLLIVIGGCEPFEGIPSEF
jgi:hypothetical protein